MTVFEWIALQVIRVIAALNPMLAANLLLNLLDCGYLKALLPSPVQEARDETI